MLVPGWAGLTTMESAPGTAAGVLPAAPLPLALPLPLPEPRGGMTCGARHRSVNNKQ